LSSRRLAAALGLLALGGGCKRDWIYIPAQPSQLVVHGVLNRVDTMQLVLIERTLSGEVGVPLALPFAVSEPIATDYGVPERDATTSIKAPDGTVYTGHEVAGCHGYPPPPAFPKCDGSGAGVYKFYLKGASIVPGGKYLLSATTKTGEVIAAETTFPEAATGPAPTPVTFNRTTDTLELSWATAAPAPAYQVRVEGSFFGTSTIASTQTKPWASFTDSTRIHLTGALRNPEDPRLTRVFMPGFIHQLSVTAVDANLYDYYRTLNNSFVGYGTVSRVKGAMGVFGSAVLIMQRNISVTATQARPIEGIWDAVDAGAGFIYFANILNVYVESPAAGKDQADAITGSFNSVSPSMTQTFTGSFQDGTLDLVLRSGTFPERLVAEMRGDTLVGTYSKGAKARFIKRR
jgi:hypothetical protein